MLNTESLLKQDDFIGIHVSHTEYCSYQDLKQLFMYINLYQTEPLVVSKNCSGAIVYVIK